MLHECTLKSTVRFTGVGLHTGAKASLALCPAPVGTGIVFRRVDFDPPVKIRVSPHYVADSRLATNMTYDGVDLATVEHLMSALSGMGIDNAYIDIDTAELPIMDGSAAPFVFLIQSAGIEEQGVPKRFLRMKKTIEVRDGDRWARLEPYDGFRLNFCYPHEGQDADQVHFDSANDSYAREIARARTFVFTQDIEMLRAQGFAIGSETANTVLIDSSRLSDFTSHLRVQNEFLRHKALDAIGDLYMAGHPILGSYSGHKANHSINNQLLRAVVADTAAWEIASFDGELVYPFHVESPIPVKTPDPLPSELIPDEISAPPKFAELFLLFICRRHERDVIIGDLTQVYSEVRGKYGERIANLWFWSQTLGVLVERGKHLIEWGVKQISKLGLK